MFDSVFALLFLLHIRFGNFTVEHGRQHHQDVSLNDCMQKSEQHSDKYGQDKAECEVIVNKLCDEHSGQQRAEESEAHRDGQREVFERAPHSPEPGPGDAAGQNDEIGKESQRDRGIDVRKRRRQRDRHSARRLHGNAHQLEQRPHKDIDARRKDVCAEEAVAVRTVLPGKSVEKPDYGFDEKLEFSGDLLEFRNGEYTHRGGEYQNDQRHRYARNERRIHIHPE